MSSLKYVVHSHGLWIPASTRSLKSSKVGADMTLAGRLFQRWSVDGKDSCIRRDRAGKDGTERRDKILRAPAKASDIK